MCGRARSIGQDSDGWICQQLKGSSSLLERWSTAVLPMVDPRAPHHSDTMDSPSCLLATEAELWAHWAHCSYWQCCRCFNASIQHRFLILEVNKKTRWVEHFLSIIVRKVFRITWVGEEEKKYWGAKEYQKMIFKPQGCFLHFFSD